MDRRITISRMSKTRFAVELFEGEEVVSVLQLNPFSEAGITKLLALTSYPSPALRRLLAPLHADDASPLTISLSGHAGEPFTVYVRPLLAPSSAAVAFEAATPCEAIRQALAADVHPSGEPILSWPSVDRLAVLDVDYHHTSVTDRPSLAEARNLVARVQPQPVAWHTSHGKGVKLYYAARDDFEASELAGAAALQWASLDARASFEVKRDSRHPMGYRKLGEVCSKAEFIPSSTMESIRGWFASAENNEGRDRWLASKRWHLGERFDHSQCLIRPDLDTTGEPVFTGDRGVYCHYCASKGHRATGARAPGFVSYSSLTGSADRAIAVMLKNFVHWHHAKFTLYDRTRVNLVVLKYAYRGALKLLHGTDDPRIDKVFTARDIVRFAGRWMFNGGRLTLSKDSRAMLEELPACLDLQPRADGSVKATVNKGTVDEFRHGGNDLSEYGYAPLSPVRGFPLWGHRLPYPDGRVPYSISRAELPPERAPRYVPLAQRMHVDRAWTMLDDVYPGIDRTYVTALLAAKGCIEGGQPSVFFVIDGPSGAGKSTSASIAAAIAGDLSGEITWNRSLERFRQNVLEAVDCSDLVRCDEVFKNAAREKMTAQQALDPILNLTPDSLSHKLYVGPVTIGRNFVVIFTDIGIPADVVGDLQLSRRLYYYRLSRRVPDWKKTSAEKGIGDPKHIRRDSSELCAACDSILSDVIDRFFSFPHTFAEIAAKLGVDRLDESESFAQPTEILADFFKAVCDAPTLTGGDAKVYPGRGWKRVTRNYDRGDSLSELWASLCDDRGSGWFRSRRIDEQDWSRVLGLAKVPDFGVSFECTPRGTDAAILRFRVGTMKKPIAVNEEILDNYRKKT